MSWPMTAGRTALLEVLAVSKAEFVAARCQVTPAAVYHWASGRWKPSPRARHVLAENYGIPEASWTVTRS